MSVTITYDDPTFRSLFPAYANTTTYPQATVQAWWNSATNYVSNTAYGWNALTTAQRTQAVYLMTAHLIYLSAIIVNGQATGVMTASSIDKISITLEPPPAKNAFQYWLASSPYGMQLRALLYTASVGGLSYSTSSPVNAFRPIWGGWC